MTDRKDQRKETEYLTKETTSHLAIQNLNSSAIIPDQTTRPNVHTSLSGKAYSKNIKYSSLVDVRLLFHLPPSSSPSFSFSLLQNPNPIPLFFAPYPLQNSNLLLFSLISPFLFVLSPQETFFSLACCHGI